MPANEILLFSTRGPAERAARLHAPGCQCVTAARNSRGRVVVIDTDVAANVADLTERKYPVKRCKCLT